MDSPSLSVFRDMDNFPFDTSTPVARKKFKTREHSILNPCNLTSEFINDDFFDDTQFENALNEENPIEERAEEPINSSLQLFVDNVETSFENKHDNDEDPLGHCHSQRASKKVTNNINSPLDYCRSQTVKERSPNVVNNCNSPIEIHRSQSAKDRSPNVANNCNSPLGYSPKGQSPRARNEFNSPFSTSFVSASSFLSKCKDLSPTASNSISNAIIQKLRHNVSASPSALIPRKVRKTSLLFALDEAQKLHEQLSQSSVGPFFGLPSKMSELLTAHKGISELYDWQKECLMLPAVKQKRNLIYSLPTSGGKTLVAEILIIRELLCYFRDAILVLPYISLVQEKVRGLAPFAVDLDFVIEECAGIKGTIPPRKRRKRHTLYICTIEKSHSLVNSMIEAKRMDEIGLIVVDELHMIGETGRGAVLESMLAKVLFVSKRTQIIGMSATLSNMGDLQQFLNADIYQKDFRPIELKEYVKVGDELYELVNKQTEEWRLVRKLDFGYTKEMLCRDPDVITGLVMEVIPQNSCLVFCPTKKHCENVAKTLCQLLPKHICEYKQDKKEALLHTLREEGNGNICEILAQSLKFGVAYHHSGLTMDERKLIEEAYQSGTLCCLTCTSTLAAGVNLPAKRVILRAPYVGIDFITLSRYKQMIGRAGRAGIDSSGESILMIKPTDRMNIGKLLTSDMDSCCSNFTTQPDRLHTLLLSLVGLEIASTMPEVYSFMEKTLAAVQNRNTGGTPSSLFEETVSNLCDNGLLQRNAKKDPVVYSITNLGRAAYRGGVDIATMKEFLNRLNQGLSGLVLHSHLHLLYLVTPTDLSSSIRFSSDTLYNSYSKLSPEDLTVAEQIGVTERTIMLMASGRSLGKNQPLLHHFYLTLILYDLWNQESVWHVAQKYQVHRGVIQNLLNNTSALAATLSNFCQELSEFWAYQQLLPNFVKQLSYCVTMELIPLMELPAVKRGRAKQLYTAGYKTLTDIAKATPREMVDKIIHLPLKTANQIISAAKMILMEKAEALHEEAEVLMEEFDKHFSIFDDVSDISANIGNA
ncbi:hypothetical protein JTE90_005672 [Oedothorax gibbosus]|uniref:Helicase POLQ-like n=1 Tax=Oedothorax gibbosus TaxID=931172 RepID=A0AAV6UHR8_9ARAC|nr:hypothetical protein JTE90_005672 [Oedothorax gibbosus]